MGVACHCLVPEYFCQFLNLFDRLFPALSSTYLSGSTFLDFFQISQSHLSEDICHDKGILYLSIRVGKLADPQLACFVPPDFKSLLEYTLAELLPIAILVSMMSRGKNRKKKKADRKGEKRMSLFLGQQPYSFIFQTVI